MGVYSVYCNIFNIEYSISEKKILDILALGEDKEFLREPVSRLVRSDQVWRERRTEQLEQIKLSDCQDNYITDCCFGYSHLAPAHHYNISDKIYFMLANSIV